MKENAIIFGANGFIGSHVAQAMRQAGMNVIGVVRPDRDSRFLSSIGIDVHILDQFELHRMSQLMQGQHYVINCSADVRLHKTLQTYRKTQVDLTETLVRAAAKARCGRFIQLSTIEIYGHTPPKPVDENFPAAPVHAFQQANLEREQTVIKTANELGLEFTILRPASTFGRRYQLLEYLLKAYQQGRFPLIDNGKARMSAIDTRDIGYAMVHVARHPEAANATFHVQAYETSMMVIKNIMDELTGCESKSQNLPLPVARLLSKTFEFILPHSKTPPLTSFAIDAITSIKLFNDDKLRALGFKPKYNMRDTFDNILRHVEDDYGLQPFKFVDRQDRQQELAL